MKITAKNRTIWIIAIVAVVCMGAGIAVGKLIVSPAQAAAHAEPPAAGPITVKAEMRTIANVVTLRADATYDDPVDVTLDTTGLGAGAVVTGQVPEVGSTIAAGSVVMQVAGRPVIALPGDLRAYRTLMVGESGPDVLQLKRSLVSLGFNPGNAESDVYDADTANAVAALYGAVGYPAPAASTEAQAALDLAQKGVTSAEAQLTTANQALSTAKEGPKQSERISAQNAVDQAQRALDAIPEACPTIEDPDTGQQVTDTSSPCGPAARADANDALRLAIAQHDEMLKPRDTSAERAAVTDAQQALTDAKDALTKAQRDAMVALPSSEVIFLPSLPRRVDAVYVTYGGTVSGSIMTVSGATLQLVASAAKSDADLLEVGTEATFALPDSGTQITATVQEIKAPTAAAPSDGGDGGDSSGGSKPDSNRYSVIFALPELTGEQIGELQGRNVKITIPVSSTGGDVLAVPISAVQVGPGGTSRVEKAISDPRAATFESELINVETGLAAEGYVEIKPDGDLKAGDLVVVGVS